MVSIWISLLAGVGLGWIACHYLAVRHLIWTVRDMRKEHFVYDRPVDRLRTDDRDTISMNET